ncbi:hypothetical protein IWQ61_002387 [Dispira simplex]|nr:hypothetical protein IWQ61_002387 [Dispira simplex]
MVNRAIQVRQNIRTPWWKLFIGSRVVVSQLLVGQTRHTAPYQTSPSSKNAATVAGSVPTPAAHWQVVINNNHFNRQVRPAVSRVYKRPALVPHATGLLRNHYLQWKNGVQDLGYRLLFAFLPENYPHSVTKEYCSYCQWQFLHNVTGSVTGVVSTQSMLYAVGLGAGSIPLAAALNWVIKDGLGQLGGVVYACHINSRFDSDPKHYKFWSGATMQMATFLEIMTPLFPGWFLVWSSMSNIAKNVSWLATSASRAHIHQSFVTSNNLGDITAKAGSQSTAAGLVGTGVGILASACLSSSMTTAFALFVPFSAISIYANYRANKVVVSRYLNLQRAELVIHHWFKQRSPIEWMAHPAPTEKARSPRPLTPDAIASAERFVRRPDSPWCGSSRLLQQPPFHTIVQGGHVMGYEGALELDRCLQNSYFNGPESYIIYPCRSVVSPRLPRMIQSLAAWCVPTLKAQNSTVAICLWYQKACTYLDILRAMYHVCAVRHQRRYSTFQY